MEADARTGDGDGLRLARPLRFRHTAWWAIVILAVLTSGVLITVWRYQHRFVRSDQDLLRLLPKRPEASIFFANVTALRVGGYLGLLQDARASQERQYTEFVRATGFDYTKDLDAVAGEITDGQLWVTLRGHFQWQKIREYAGSHDGNCGSSACVTDTSTPGRALTLRAIQPDVMGVAVGGDVAAAEEIRAGQNPSPFVFDAPVWIRPSEALMMNPASLPVALRIFAISLGSADSVVLALRSSEAEETRFAITIDALFRNEPTAQTAKKQLEIDTSMLRIELMRERRQPDPGNLSWLLTSGTFQVTGQRLAGAWPVRKELIRSLQ